MAALITLVLIVPMYLIGTGIFVAASGFRAPSRPRYVGTGLPLAQVARDGRNPLRAPAANRRHPIEGALRVVVGTLMFVAGVSAYRELYELFHYFG